MRKKYIRRKHNYLIQNGRNPKREKVFKKDDTNKLGLRCLQKTASSWPASHQETQYLKK